MTSTDEIFDEIYQTDLVYEKDCFKLCDAHCCSGFASHKAQFKFMATGHFNELPLLPGEYEYMKARGYLEQFGDHDHRVIPFELSKRSIKYETIVSRKPGCACNHATRTTICRLYPLIPQYDCKRRSNTKPQ